MKVSSLVAVVVIASALRSTMEAGETQPPAPTLRHVNYVAIHARRGKQIRCQATCLPRRSSAYRDSLKCRLVRPDGFVAASARVQPGEETTFAANADWDGICAIEIRAGWHLAQVRLKEKTPHAYRSCVHGPMKTVRAWGPLYFHVPKATRYFNIWLHASVTREGLHYTIKNPDGEAVRDEEGDFDARTKIQIQVPHGQDAAAWSIEISKPKQQGLYLDDVYVELGRHLPPFLAPTPEWATLFAGDWRYDPQALKPQARLRDTKPKIEPFRGVTGPEIDRTYSRDMAKGWHTTLPFTYVLDYGSKHLGNADYVPMVGTAPPVLLHLGKDVPLNHGWGPVKALGGENQAYGTGTHIERISPAQVRERISGLRKMVDALHKNGVRWVTPYICGMTVNGDHERRTGFWDFYDHWDDYRPLGLGPRPKDDPFNWLQRHPDGTVRQYYRYDYPDEHYPPFKENHRYAACWHSEGWRTWLCEVVRFAAKCGQDGVFVDNACSQRCQCDRCLAAFRRYLKMRFTAERARRLFDSVSLDAIAFPEKKNTPLYAEMNRFWCETVRDELATLKAAGSKELGREFVVFPNGGRPTFIQRGLMDADFVMFEKSHGDYGTHPGTVLSPVFEGVTLRAYNDNIFEHKFVQCLRRRVKPIILSRAGWPRRPPSQMLNANAARLGMAECGAFSGGGGFLLRPNFGVYHDAMNEYRRFFETHPQLYAGLDSYARVAVLACPEQQWLGNAAHMGTVRSLTDCLTEAHVLFDYVSEARLEKSALERYAIVLAPEFRVVSDSQFSAVADYVNSGGHLVVIGDFAVRDDSLAERQPGSNERAPLLTVPAGITERCGRGSVSRCMRVEEALAAFGDGFSVLACPNKDLAPRVKINAFHTPGESAGRIVVHVVNYNVPLGVDAPEPTPVDGIELDMPLPKGTRTRSIAIYAPEEAAPASLPVNGTNGRTHIRIPELQIYRVIEMRLAPLQ